MVVPLLSYLTMNTDGVMLRATSGSVGMRFHFEYVEDRLSIFLNAYRRYSPQQYALIDTYKACQIPM